jgi:hypothetical protein
MQTAMKSLALSAFAIFGLVVAPSEAAAGLCGSSCISCEGAPSPDYKTGDGTAGHQTYKLFCTTGACTRCSFEEQLATTASERRASLAGRIRSSRRGTLEPIVAENRSRLRVDASRSILAVLGGCDGKTVQSIVVLNAEQLTILRRAGVASLASHYASLRTQPTARLALAR